MLSFTKFQHSNPGFKCLEEASGVTKRDPTKNQEGMGDFPRLPGKG